MFKQSLETRMKRSATIKAKFADPAYRKRKSETYKQMYKNGFNPTLGKHWKLSKETRRRQSLAQSGEKNPGYGKTGEKCHFWRGGITSANKRERTTLVYRQWRKAVFERDNYQCVIGGKEHGNKLNADHIKPFAYFPKLRNEITNGRTLCVACHRQTDTFAGKGRIY